MADQFNVSKTEGVTINTANAIDNTGRDNFAKQRHHDACDN